MKWPDKIGDGLYKPAGELHEDDTFYYVGVSKTPVSSFCAGVRRCRRLYGRLGHVAGKVGRIRGDQHSSGRPPIDSAFSSIGSQQSSETLSGNRFDCVVCMPRLQDDMSSGRESSPKRQRNFVARQVRKHRKQVADKLQGF